MKASIFCLPSVGSRAEIEAAAVAIPRSLAMLRMGSAAIAADPLGQGLARGVTAGA